MALSQAQLQRVLATLPERYRKAYAEGEVTDEQIEAYAYKLGVKPDFSNVTSGSSQSEPEGPGILDILKNLGEDALDTQQAVQRAGLAGAKRMVGAAGFAGADDAIGGVTAGPRAVAEGALDLVGLGDLLDKRKEQGREVFGDLFQKGTDETEAVNKDLDRLNYGKTVAEPLTDVAGSPTSLASIFGGPAAVAPFADVYAQEYTEARLSGLTKDQAKARALLHAGVEGAVEAVPAGKVLGNIPGLDKLVGREAAEAIMSDVAKTAVRTGRIAAGEGIEEGVTTLAQLGIDKVIAATSSDENLRQFAGERIPEDIVGVWDATWRSVKAGAVGGTAIGGPIEKIRTTHERAKLVSEMVAGNADTRGQLRLRKQADLEAIERLKQGRDLFGEIPTQAEPEAEPTAVGSDQDGRTEMLRTRVGALDMRIAEEEANLKALNDEKYKTLMGESGETFEKFDDQKIKRTEAWIKSAKNARERLAKQLTPSQPELPLDAPEQPKPKATSGVVPTRDPDKFYDPNGVIQSRALERAKGDAAKLIEEDKAAQEKARVESYNKTRQKVRTDLVKESRELPDGERAEFVANKLATWDLENPMDSWQAPKSKTKKPVATKTPLTVKPREEDVKTEEVEETTEGLKSVEELKAALGEPMAMDVDFLRRRVEDLSDEKLLELYTGVINKEQRTEQDMDILQEVTAERMKRNRGAFPKEGIGTPNLTDLKLSREKVGQVAKPQLLKQEGGDKTDTKADDILNTLAEKMGGTDAKKVGKMIADRNMVVVNDVSEVPGNAQERGAGFFDGERTYIVANRINKKNAMGEILSIAAHEVKHQADLAGTPQLKASLGGFIGKSANAQLNKKIEALAKADKQVAKVVEAARNGSQNDAQYALELPAYFINYARTKRDQKGAVARLAGNVVSAVRTKFGGDVNLDDVAYMSDKLLKEVAVQGERLTTGLNDPLPMFISKGRGKMEASINGRTYESVDGAIKYEISDDKSAINYPLVLQKEIDPETVWRADEILKHDELYNELPALKNVRVRFIYNPHNAFRGEFQPVDNIITLNLAHTGERNGFIYGGQTHRTLLHEMQHAAQFLSGTTGGSNPERHLSPDYGQLSAAIRALDSMILRATMEGDVRMSEELNQQRDKFISLVRKAENKAFNDYQSVLGEHEARATADRLTLNQRQRDKQVGDMEPIYVHDTGMILDQDGKPFVTKEDLLKAPEYILAFNPDFLAGAQDYTVSRATKLGSVLKTQLQNFGGLERELGVAKEDADGHAARSAHRAMNFYTRIHEGISIIARRGVKEGTYKNADEGRKAINDMIEGRLQAISKLDDQNRREAALAGLLREYPELQALGEALSEVNQQSRMILLQMIQDKPNPTPKELKQMNTIYNNMYRYSTRMYAAFQGEDGREHSRRLLNEAKHGEDALAKRGVVPEKFRESFEIYQRGLRYIIDHDITIPEDDVLDSMKQDRIDQLYDTWIQDGASRTKQLAKAAAMAQGMSEAKAKNYVRDYMVEKLRERRGEISGSEYEATARDIIRGMLELEESTSPFANYYRGFKQDRGILMERERIAPEIRALLGEITDPATRMAVTISKQGELIARTRLLLDMKEKGNGRWVMPAVDARLPGNEKFSAALDGENWGPLQGWRATPEVARAIGDTVEMIQTLSDALAKSYQNTSGAVTKAAITGTKGVVKAAGLAKLTGIVWEPFGMAFNFFGSFAMPIANGVVNPKYYARGLRTGGTVIMDTLYDGKGKLTPEFEDAVRWGILDSARVQEIRRTPQKFVRELISSKPKTVNALIKYTQRGGRTAVEIFAMADAWSKITAFQQRVDVLRDFYKAEGIEKTDDQIKSEAADQIKDTNITYARTIAAVRNIESVGLTTFMPYFYSVPRALTYGYIQAAKDLVRGFHATSGKGKQVMIQQGLQRLAGNSAATMGQIALLKAIAAAVNGDDEDKIVEMKKLMSEDARFADSVYLGKDKLGNPLFMRLSRVDAYGPVNDAIRVVLDDTLSPEDKSKYTVKMITDLIFTNRFTKSAIQAGYEVLPGTEIRDKELRIERVFPKATENVKDWIAKVWGLDEDDAESAMAVLDSFSPGWLDTFDPTNKVVAEGTSPDAKLLGDMIVAMGGRLDRADPGLAASVAGSKVGEARDEGRKRIARGILAGRSEDTLTDIFIEYAGKEYDAMREVADVYSGMVNGLGMSPREAGKVIKEEGQGITETDIAALRQGRIIPEADDWVNQGTRLLSKKSMEERMTSGRKRDPEELKEAQERAEAFRKKMKALGYKVRED